MEDNWAVRLEDQFDMMREDIGTEREWVAVGIEDKEGFAEVVALTHPDNARLIAAAPEMLEALKLVYKLACDSDRNGNKKCIGLKEYNNMVCTVYDVIRKAEGRT